MEWTSAETRRGLESGGQNTVWEISIISRVNYRQVTFRNIVFNSENVYFLISLYYSKFDIGDV
jgi:hypothetical protein